MCISKQAPIEALTIWFKCTVMCEKLKTLSRPCVKRITLGTDRHFPSITQICIINNAYLSEWCSKLSGLNGFTQDLNFKEHACIIFLSVFNLLSWNWLCWVLYMTSRTLQLREIDREAEFNKDKGLNNDCSYGLSDVGLFKVSRSEVNSCLPLRKSWKGSGDFSTTGKFCYQLRKYTHYWLKAVN